MKRHVPATCYGDITTELEECEECLVCGATRSYLPTKSLVGDIRYTPWRLAGKPEPYCQGKEEKP